MPHTKTNFNPGGHSPDGGGELPFNGDYMTAFINSKANQPKHFVKEIKISRNQPDIY